MQLKSIEIIGFKSFAEKTKISFPNGMTGIVGPNGSGKSNIAEAIRWVLGEQSAKNLRGSRMPDVIFSGSADRRALNMAAVTLLLDNSDHYLDSPFTEIKVARKLFRNGDSAYFINEKQCRLKDVTNLFMDTGIGQGTLSIISQGNVEEIFNSKPVDRRSIIENVAGVYKYKRQKTTAQTEILQTSDNLNRVNDIIQELKSRLAPLEEQSSQATDYLDQKKRLAEFEKKQLILTAKDQQAAIKQTTDQLKQSQQIVSKIQKEVDQNEQSGNAVKQELSAGRKQIDDWNAETLAINTKIQTLTSQKQLSTQENSFKNADVKRISDQISATTAKIHELAQKIDKSATAISHAQDSLRTGQAGLVAVEKAAKANNVPAIEKKIEQLRSQYVDLMQEQTAINNQLTMSQHDQSRLAEQAKSQKARISQLTGKLADGQKQLTEKRQQLAQSKADLAAVQEKLAHLKQLLTAKQATVDQNQTEWLNALKVAEQAKAKQNSLQALHDSYRNFYRGPANLLKNKAHLDGIFGPVSDFLQVDSQYVKAIDTALGSQAQHIIVKDNAAASNAIKFMTANRYGRVTLLPVTVIKPRYLNRSLVAQAEKFPGYIGVGSSLVTMPEQFADINESLLGTTIIADNLDHAIAISRAIQHRTRIVSLDGQVVNAGGSLTGGANKATNQGVLINQTELADLQKATQQMGNKLTAKETQLAEAKNALQQIQEAYNRSHQRAFEVQQGINHQAADLKLLETAIATETREVEAMKLALQNAQNLNSADQDTDLQKQKAAIQKQLAANNQAVLDHQARLGRVRELADEYAKKRQSLHDQVVVTKEQLQQYQDQRRSLDNQLLQLSNQKTRLTTQLQDLKADLQQQVDPAQLDEQIAQQTKRQAALSADLNEKKVAVDRLDQTYEKIQNAIRTAQLNLNNAKYELKATGTKLSSLQQAISVSYTKLSEKYSIDPQALANPKWNWDADAVAGQIKMLKMGIEEIGPVNISAIQEFHDVSDRYNFLMKQQQDLLTAKNHLTATMGKMDSTIASKFKQTFDKVANSFSKVFVEMFGGGEAKLVLTDPDDLLATGIEIMVKPPGKNYRSLSLLSGGEKALTAITLLFAIIRVSPVPFCILDEAEAALDPFNADRFAKYLKRFGDETQFIVITHRKETMIYADTLYGITMQESGVSKVVSVSLDNLKTEVS